MQDKLNNMQCLQFKKKCLDVFMIRIAWAHDNLIATLNKADILKENCGFDSGQHFFLQIFSKENLWSLRLP